MATPVKRVVIAHPSADRYGSDLQVLLSAKALHGAGWRVTLVVPSPGPLVDLATDADVRILSFAVLRKSSLSLWGLLRLAGQSGSDVARLCSFLRKNKPDFVYVNTITIPTWILAARICRIPVLTHVHEAESDHPRALRLGLTLPLLLSRTVVANSHASANVLTQAIAQLRARTVVLHNGVPDSGDERAPEAPNRRLVYLGRLSPRKGVDTALDALARVIADGIDAHLDICGSTFPGYEYYETELRTRAAEPDLAGHVQFLGYVRPVSQLLSRAAALVMPSRHEPFGNVAVEALMARCPVVVSRVQGLQEVVIHEVTGLLVPPDDPVSLAAAITRTLRQPDQAAARAEAGRADALARFSLEVYEEKIRQLAEEMISP